MKKLIKPTIFFLFLLAITIGMYKWLTRYQLFGDYVRSVNTDKKLIALTFDDGPNPVTTTEIVNLLKKYNAKATFFVLGKHAEKHPELLQLIYKNGNEIGNHSWNHEKLIFRAPSYVKSEINSTDEVIRASGYPGEIYFRSPYGSRLIVLPYVLSKMNRTHVLWNVALYDWELGVNEMHEIFKDNIGPGSIVLLHDGYPHENENRQNTVEFTELILKEYGDEYKFVTLSELLSNQ